MIYLSSRSPRTLLQGILIASLALLIAACGSSSKTPPDTTPEPFTFTAVSGVEPGAWQSSERVTVSGINTATPISVSGGQYAIGSGAFTAAAGQITNGQELRVRIQAPEQASADGKMTVTVGTYSTTFEVFTFDDETPPTATIAFPPPFSATDRETLTVRGTAQDDYSAVAGVTLKVTHGESVTEVEAESDDGFATWTADVTLAAGEMHTFTVEAIDTADNQNTNAAEAVVHQQAFGLAFPDDEVPITFVRGIAFDEANNRVLISNISGNAFVDDSALIIAVDMATGKRTIFSSPTVTDDENVKFVIRGIALDSGRDRLLAVSALNASIYTVSLEEGSTEILSGPTTPNNEPPAMTAPTGVAIDPNDSDYAYVATYEARNVVRVHLETGEKTLISDNTMPETGPAFSGPEALMIDGERNRALVLDRDARTLYAVDLTSGVRTVIAEADDNADETMVGLASITSDDLTNRVIVTTTKQGVLSIDLHTGERTQIHPMIEENLFITGSYIHVEPGSGVALWVDRFTQGLYALDLESQTYVIISKSSENVEGG